LLAWVRDYYTRQEDLSLVGHQALFDSYSGVKHRLVDRPGSEFLKESAAWAT
jgi:hypothetical protein